MSVTSGYTSAFLQFFNFSNFNFIFYKLERPKITIIHNIFWCEVCVIVLPENIFRKLETR